MKSFNRHFSRLALLTIIASTIFVSCKDDEPGGPASALGKQFNLAVPEVTSALPYSLIVSADGTNIVASMLYNNSQIMYSSDGGTSFTQVYANYLAPQIVAVDNIGNILSYDNRVFSLDVEGVNTYINAEANGDQLILGDNGKVFSYNSGSIQIKQRSIASGSFAVVENPAVPELGAAVFVMKAVGKGLLYLETKNETARAYVLDEATLQWSDPVDFTYDHDKINTCTNLNQFERFSYVGNNIILLKGCTGAALLDMSSSNITYVDFPDSDELIYTDLRDGMVYIDSKKQIYIVAGRYDDLANKYVYRYDGSEWSPLEGSLLTGTPVFTADQAGNIYFNTNDGAGGSVKGAVKLNIDSGTKTGLKVPTTKLTITDAAALDGNTILLIADAQLFEHDIASGTTTSNGLTNVSHINILSDGRLVAGGVDNIFLSSDNGATWKETKKVFSSVDPAKGTCSIARSRLVNGKIMLDGVYAYFYDNLTTGTRQDKYDNIAVEFDGTSSSKLPYTFPGDFDPSAIGNDGTIYGVSVLYFSSQATFDPYELMPNVTPVVLKEFTYMPRVIADSGLQMTIKAAQAGGLEVQTRNSPTEDWKAANTPLPGTPVSTVELRLSGDHLLVINGTEVYISGN